MSRCAVSLCTQDQHLFMADSGKSDHSCKSAHAEIVFRGVVDRETIVALRSLGEPASNLLKEIPPDLLGQLREPYRLAMEHFNLPPTLWSGRIKRYVNGHFHNWHVDTKRMFPFGLDYSLALSHPDEYEGGEYETRAESYRLAPGDMLFLPSSVEHRVKTVTGGQRFVLVGAGVAPSLMKLPGKMKPAKSP
jgi:hypothetical protein